MSTQIEIKRPVNYYAVGRLSKTSKGVGLHDNQVLTEWLELAKCAFEDDEVQSNGSYEFQLRKVDYENKLMVVSLHAPMNLKYATRKDGNGKQVDVNENDEFSRELATSTVLVLGEIESRLFVAITKGTANSAPGITAVKSFLHYAIPLPGASKWETKGVLSPSDKEKLRNSSGVTMFEGTIAGHIDDGVVGVLGANALTRAISMLADEIGTDILVSFKVEFPDADAASQQRGRNIAADAPWILGTKKPKAKAKTATGEELLTLVQHDFSSAVSLDLTSLIGARFSALVEAAETNFKDETPRISQLVLNSRV